MANIKTLNGFIVQNCRTWQEYKRAGGLAWLRYRLDMAGFEGSNPFRPTIFWAWISGTCEISVSLVWALALRFWVNIFRLLLSMIPFSTSKGNSNSNSVNVFSFFLISLLILYSYALEIFTWFSNHSISVLVSNAGWIFDPVTFYSPSSKHAILNYNKYRTLYSNVLFSSTLIFCLLWCR